MHNELHWFDVPDRVNYKLGMLMYRCHLVGLRIGFISLFCLPGTESLQQRLQSVCSKTLLLTIRQPVLGKVEVRFQRQSHVIRPTNIICTLSITSNGKTTNVCVYLTSHIPLTTLTPVTISIISDHGLK